MNNSLLEHFERAICQRAPSLATRLRPGIPVSTVQKMLRDAKVSGYSEAVVRLFAWHDGTRVDLCSTLGEASLFPASVYTFWDLLTMIQHFETARESFIYHFKFVEGRYFPAFWDNASGYLAVDLKSPAQRVVLFEPESEELTREAYSSFDEFLKDAIRVNETGDTLTCLQ